VLFNVLFRLSFPMATLPRIGSACPLHCLPNDKNMTGAQI